MKRYLILLMCGAAALLSVPPVYAANAFVQSKSAAKTNGAASTEIAATFTTNVTAGNLIAVWAIWGDATKTATVAGTGGCNNTFTSADSDTAVRTEAWYAKNITGGACTVTVTWSASLTAFQTLVVHEISGADTTAPLGQHTHQSQTAVSGTDSVSSSAVTTTTAGEYIFGITVRTDSLDATQFTKGTGFDGPRESNGDGVTLTVMSEDKIQASAGSIAATFTPGGTFNTSTTIVTIKAASGAAAPITRRKTIAW